MRHKVRLDRMTKVAKWSEDKNRVVKFFVVLYLSQQWPVLVKEVRLDTIEKLAHVDRAVRPSGATSEQPHD